MLLLQDPNRGGSVTYKEDAGRNHFTRSGGAALECAASSDCLFTTVTLCVLMVCQIINLKFTCQNCIQ